MKNLFILALFAVLAFASAFAPSMPTFTSRASSLSTSITELEACRINAKKEKRLRNRDNMRKFKKRGKISRKKMMRKLASNDARAEENEFMTKCFITSNGSAETEEKK